MNTEAGRKNRLLGKKSARTGRGLGQGPEKQARFYISYILDPKNQAGCSGPEPQRLDSPPSQPPADSAVRSTHRLDLHQRSV